MRYYSPTVGRFINRDPIEEGGGLNLYGLIGNNPVGRYDILGMCGGEGEAACGGGTFTVTANRVVNRPDPLTTSVSASSLSFAQYTFNNWYGGWVGQIAAITGSITPPPIVIPPVPKSTGQIVVTDLRTGRRLRILIPGATKEQMGRALAGASRATAAVPDNATTADDRNVNIVERQIVLEYVYGGSDVTAPYAKQVNAFIDLFKLWKNGAEKTAGGTIVVGMRPILQERLSFDYRRSGEPIVTAHTMLKSYSRIDPSQFGGDFTVQMNAGGWSELNFGDKSPRTVPEIMDPGILRHLERNDIDPSELRYVAISVRTVFYDYTK